MATPNFCPSCGTKLDGAQFCPNCGLALTQPLVQKPRANGRGRLLLLLIGVAVLIIGLGFLGSSDGSTNNAGGTSPATGKDQTPATTTTAEVPNEAELKDANYLDKRYWIQGSSACDVGADDYLRQVAKYDFAWDKTGFLESKFDSYSRMVRSPGILTLITNKAKLSNAFGAFQHVTLMCDFDTQAPYPSAPVGYSIVPPSDDQPPADDLPPSEEQ